MMLRSRTMSRRHEQRRSRAGTRFVPVSLDWRRKARAQRFSQAPGRITRLLLERMARGTTNQQYFSATTHNWTTLVARVQRVATGAVSVPASALSSALQLRYFSEQRSVMAERIRRLGARSLDSAVAPRLAPRSALASVAQHGQRRPLRLETEGSAQPSVRAEYRSQPTPPAWRATSRALQVVASRPLSVRGITRTAFAPGVPSRAASALAAPSAAPVSRVPAKLAARLPRPAARNTVEAPLALAPMVWRSAPPQADRAGSHPAECVGGEPRASAGSSTTAGSSGAEPRLQERASPPGALSWTPGREQLERLAEDVMRRIDKRSRVERERRGM